MIHDAATCSDYHSIQLHHVDLDMDVNFQSKTITGHATLWMKRLTLDTTIMELKLDVFHLEIQDVQVKIDENTLRVTSSSWMIEKFTSFGDALVLELPSAVATKKEFQLIIKYQTKQTSPGVCWLDKEQTAGKKYPYLFTQGQEVLNRSFFPCQDSPSVRVTYTANVHVPKELVCVMSAKSLGFQEKIKGKRLFRFEMRQSIPIYLVAMAIGDLVSGPIGPRSNVWTEPCMLESSQKEFQGEIEKFLQIGERLFGAYQWEQYDVLVMPPSFPYGGMENPRLTFLSPTIVTGDKSLCSGK
jgi:aminopeptidase B